MNISETGIDRSPRCCSDAIEEEAGVDVDDAHVPSANIVSLEYLTPVECTRVHVGSQLL